MTRRAGSPGRRAPRLPPDIRSIPPPAAPIPAFTSTATAAIAAPTATAARPTAAPAILAWLGFVDRQVPTVVSPSVEPLDRRLRLGVRAHLDETKSLRAVRISIDD